MLLLLVWNLACTPAPEGPEAPPMRAAAFHEEEAPATLGPPTGAEWSASATGSGLGVASLITEHALGAGPGGQVVAGRVEGTSLRWGRLEAEGWRSMPDLPLPAGKVQLAVDGDGELLSLSCDPRACALDRAREGGWEGLGALPGGRAGLGLDAEGRALVALWSGRGAGLWRWEDSWTVMIPWTEGRSGEAHDSDLPPQAAARGLRGGLLLRDVQRVRQRWDSASKTPEEALPDDWRYPLSLLVGQGAEVGWLGAARSLGEEPARRLSWEDQRGRGRWERWAQLMRSSTPALALDAQGRLVVAQAEVDSLPLWREGPRGWERLVPPPGLWGQPEEPSLLALPEGLLLAWVQTEPGEERGLRAALWTDEGWRDWGRIDGTSSDSHALRLSRGGDGSVLAGWVEEVPGASAQYLRRRAADGRWLELGQPAPQRRISGQGAAAMPRLRLDARGEPWLAWWDRAEGQVELREATALGWKEHPSLPVPELRGLALEFDDVGRPVLGLESGAAGLGGIWAEVLEPLSGWQALRRAQMQSRSLALSSGITVLGARAAEGLWLSRFGGSTWSALPALPGAQQGAWALWRSPGDGELHVAWSDGPGEGLRLRRLGSQAWTELGEGGPICQSAEEGMEIVAIDISTDLLGQPAVAWRWVQGERSGIGLCRWTEDGWLLLPEDAAFAGLGPAPRLALDLGLDAAGQPLVAAEVMTAAGPRIRLRRWQGERWEAPPWTGAEGDWSPCLGTCTEPSLALRGPRSCLAWIEGGPEGHQARLSCVDEAGPGVFALGG